MKAVIRFLGWKGSLLVIILTFALIIGLQNLETVSIDFFFWKFFEVPKLYLIVFSFLVGGFTGALAFGMFLSKNLKKPVNKNQELEV